jgi:hypothetical protein
VTNIIQSLNHDCELCEVSETVTIFYRPRSTSAVNEQLPANRQTKIRVNTAADLVTMKIGVGEEAATSAHPDKAATNFGRSREILETRGRDANFL